MGAMSPPSGATAVLSYTYFPVKGFHFALFMHRKYVPQHGPDYTINTRDYINICVTC